MTKTSTFKLKYNTKKNPIEFKLRLLSDGTTTNEIDNPSSYDEIQLIDRNYGDGDYDLMLACNEGYKPEIYLGYWNHGVVD